LIPALNNYSKSLNGSSLGIAKYLSRALTSLRHGFPKMDAIRTVHVYTYEIEIPTYLIADTNIPQP
jgi:hypothetical protein